jgi:hypothetical protein
MSKRKLLTAILLLAALMAVSFGTALAAPAAQETTPLTGTVETIVVEVDPVTLETTVVVTVKDNTGAMQDVRLSAADAAALGLVALDPATNTYVPVAGKEGTEITIDPGIIIPDEGEDGEEEGDHPVADALSDFFSEVLGVDYDTIMEAHEDGAGFGVIAQALWITNELEGDSETFEAIMEAKKTGDYSMITMPDGSTPQNWGQFRKALLSGDKKKNLGAIMSGHADPLSEGDGAVGKDKGNKDKDHGKSGDKSNNGRGNSK